MSTNSIPASVTIVFSKDGATLRGGETVRRNPDTSQLLAAIPIGKDPDFPFSMITGEINAAALAQVAALSDQLTAAQADANAKAATIAQLQGQLAAAAPAPVTGEDAFLHALNDAYNALIPPEYQIRFADVFSRVRVLIQAGRKDLALGVIQATQVPPELADAKAHFLAALA